MSDIVTGRIFSNGEVGITATKMNEIISRSVIQPDLIGTKPAASSAGSTDYLLLLKSDGTLAKIAGDAFNTSVANAILPQVDAKIWSARLRSFNAAGNPNFEVDQRNVGQTSGLGSGRFITDRWYGQNTLTATGGQNPTTGTDVLVPGTNFKISNRFLRITVTAQKTSLAATDNLSVYQNVEGSSFRELSNDVHSISLLVRSSVAGLSFGLTLRDGALTYSLCKLCTIPSANTWALIQLPNLPIWAASGTFSGASGALSYLLTLGLALGSNFIASSNDAWISGNYAGATGQSNFAASPVNSTFDIAFVQHEPGSQCTTLIDKPFQQNLDECLRCYAKSQQYGQAIGIADSYGAVGSWVANGPNVLNGFAPFPKTMAKAPTVTLYSPQTGAANTVYDITNGTSIGGSPNYVGDRGFPQITSAGAYTTGHNFMIQYTADTSW